MSAPVGHFNAVVAPRSGRVLEWGRLPAPATGLYAQVSQAMKPRTRANHPPHTTLPAGRRPLVAPIYQSVKFELEDLAETERVWAGVEDGFHYSRIGNR